MKLFHLRPKGGVEGDVLMPLSDLRVTLPETYEAARQKYEAREHVPRNHIPLLDCHWEDVIFLSPVHPQILHGVLVSCGHRGLVDRKAFVVDPATLNPARLVVYEFDGETPYTYYERSHHLRYARIGEATKGFYRDAKEEGKKPFIFAGVTHVLYQGRIPIQGLPTVQVKD